MDLAALESASLDLLNRHVLVLDSAVQVVLLLIGIILAWFAGRRLRIYIDKLRETRLQRIRGAGISKLLQGLGPFRAHR